MIAMAEAEQEKLRKEGAGRAAAVEAEGRAEAAKIEAIGLAQAKAIEAQGVAEATAILRKAEAWKEFNDAARLQTILEKLPAIIEASTGVFGAVAAPMGNIDKLVVIDQGGANGDGGSGSLARLAKTSPAVVFNVLQQLEAFGLNVPTVMQQLGINPAVLSDPKPQPPRSRNSRYMPDTSLRVVARITARPDTVNQVREILLGLVAPTRAEEGCVVYELLQNRTDPTDFTFVEEWASDATFERHHTTEHIRSAFPKLQALVAVPPDIRTYSLVRML